MNQIDKLSKQEDTSLTDKQVLAFLSKNPFFFDQHQQELEDILRFSQPSPLDGKSLSIKEWQIQKLRQNNAQHDEGLRELHNIIQKNYLLSRVFSDLINHLSQTSSVSGVMRLVRRKMREIGYVKSQLWALDDALKDQADQMPMDTFKLVSSYINDRGLYLGYLNHDLRQQLRLAQSLKYFVLIKIKKPQTLLVLAHKDSEENHDARNTSLIEILQTMMMIHLQKIVQ